MNQHKLPQVVILYGPPAAGKGTQAQALKEILSDYYHLDFGTEIRAFVKDNFESADEALATRAKRVKDMMSVGPVTTEDLRFIVEKAITENVNAGKGMLIEGPGRLVEEAEWLSSFFDQKEVDVVIFHMHLHLEEAIHRSTNRFYIPSAPGISFKSYKEAKAAARDGAEPYQRDGDLNAEGFVQRYKALYSNHWAKIVSIYQVNAKAHVLTVDAAQTVPEVTEDINHYLESWYGVKI